MDERRGETRIECEIPVVVHAPDERGGFFEEFTVVENYSHSGACIRLTRKVLPGSLLVLSARFYPLEGTVKVNTLWQEQSGGTHKVGVMFLHPEENWLLRLYPIP
jgi:hypothetical protein